MFPDDLSVIFCLYAFLLDNPPSLFVNIYFSVSQFVVFLCINRILPDKSFHTIMLTHLSYSFLFVF